jgi:hypothetical protein
MALVGYGQNLMLGSITARRVVFGAYRCLQFGIGNTGYWTIPKPKKYREPTRQACGLSFKVTPRLVVPSHPQINRLIH